MIITIFTSHKRATTSTINAITACEIYAVLCIMRCYVGWRTERTKIHRITEHTHFNVMKITQKQKRRAERKIMDLIKIESTKCAPEKWEENPPRWKWHERHKCVLYRHADVIVWHMTLFEVLASIFFLFCLIREYVSTASWAIFRASWISSNPQRNPHFELLVVKSFFIGPSQPQRSFPQKTTNKKWFIAWIQRINDRQATLQPHEKKIVWTQ